MGDRWFTQLVILTGWKIYQFKKDYFFTVYKMVECFEKYTDGKVFTITVSNRELFWVKMHDVQERLGVKVCLI